MKKLSFKVDKEGNVQILNVEGYGQNCLAATELIEKALGIVNEKSRELTDEYNKPVSSDNHEQISAD
jgi:hypothetical protein